MPAEARFLNLVKEGLGEWGINAGNGPFSSAETLIFLFKQPRIKVVCIRSVCLMCQGSPKRPHLDALMDVPQLKEHFGPLLWFVRAETCQSPCVLCLVFRSA